MGVSGRDLTLNHRCTRTLNQRVCLGLHTATLTPVPDGHVADMFPIGSRAVLDTGLPDADDGARNNRFSGGSADPALIRTGPRAGSPGPHHAAGPAIVRSGTRRRGHDAVDAHGPTPPAWRGRYRTTKPGAGGAGTRDPGPMYTPASRSRSSHAAVSSAWMTAAAQTTVEDHSRVAWGGERHDDTRITFHVADLGPSPEVGADDVLAVEPDGVSPAAHRHGPRSRGGRAARLR